MKKPVEWDVRRAVGRGRPARDFWIPAYAGMTVIVGGTVRRMATAIIDGAVGGEIPAYAGMTERG